MRYRIVLSANVYRELRDKLPEPRAYMHGDALLIVDDEGRELIEQRLSGRVFWEAHTIPRPNDWSDAAVQERFRLHAERRRKAGLK